MEIVDISDVIVALKKNMDSTIDVYKLEISGIRTGRISPALLNAIVVKVYGGSMHINQLASVSVYDAKILIIEVWDSENVSHISKAIQLSDLGVAPIVEGNVIRIVIPPLSMERRNDMVKVAAKCAERCKISLRNNRRNYVDIAKKYAKDNNISEDVLRKTTTEIDNVIAVYVKNVDSMFDTKSAEILGN